MVDVSVRILILHFRFAGIDPDVMKIRWDVSTSKMPKMSCGKGDDIRRYVRHAFLFVAIYFHTHTHKYPDVNI